MSIEGRLQVHRHEKYYFNDGSVVFKLEPENVLYRLHVSLLCLRSGVFQNLFDLPLSPTKEGKSDEHPVVLPQVYRVDFDALIAFLFLPWHAEQDTTWESLVSVLKLSTFYEIDDGRDYAISRLRAFPSTPPSKQLYIAHLYRVDDWAEEAFRQVLSCPPRMLSAEDADLIGAHVMWILVRTHLDIDAKRRVIAFRPPDAIARSSCKTAAACHSAFEHEWWSGFARHYLHPENAVTGREMVVRLSTTKIPGVCQNCQTLIRTFIVDSGVLLREEVIVEQAVTEFLDWQTDKRIRALLPSS